MQREAISRAQRCKARRRKRNERRKTEAVRQMGGIEENELMMKKKVRGDERKRHRNE